MIRGGASRDGAAGAARASNPSAASAAERTLGERLPERAGSIGERPGAERVIGAVLCGGRSRRMGTDKALLEDDQRRTLLERAARTLEPLCETVLLAVGPALRYHDHCGPGRRLVVDAVGAGDGPLAGLAAVLALAAHEGAVLLTTPVDMPGTTPELFASLLERLRAEGGDLCLVRGPRGIEPLLGAFGPRSAGVARALLAAGERRPVALADPDHGLRAVTLELDDSQSRARLVNLNTPEDWRALAGGDPGLDRDAAARQRTFGERPTSGRRGA